MADDLAAPSFNLPIFINARGLLAVVVGGGPVGRRKAQLLLDAGATVRQIDLEPQPPNHTHVRLDWRAEPYRVDHLDGARLVFAAATTEVDRQVQHDADARQLFVCRADDARHGQFITPATLRRGRHLTIAVSTGGASPALARRIRERLAETFDESFGAWVELLGVWRVRTDAAIAPADRVRAFLDEISDWRWLDVYRAEGADAVNAAYERIVANIPRPERWLI